MVAGGCRGSHRALVWLPFSPEALALAPAVVVTPPLERRARRPASAWPAPARGDAGAWRDRVATGDASREVEGAAGRFMERSSLRSSPAFQPSTAPANAARHSTAVMGRPLQRWAPGTRSDIRRRRPGGLLPAGLLPTLKLVCAVGQPLERGPRTSARQRTLAGQETRVPSPRAVRGLGRDWREQPRLSSSPPRRTRAVQPARPSPLRHRRRPRSPRSRRTAPCIQVRSATGRHQIHCFALTHSYGQCRPRSCRWGSGPATSLPARRQRRAPSCFTRRRGGDRSPGTSHPGLTCTCAIFPTSGRTS